MSKSFEIEEPNPKEVKVAALHLLNYMRLEGDVGGSFREKLIGVFDIADNNNYDRLRSAFPDLGRAFDVLRRDGKAGLEELAGVEGE